VSAAARAWERTRLLVLRRDRYLCQACRKATATEVARTAEGPADGLDHLQALCVVCNAEPDRLR